VVANDRAEGARAADELGRTTRAVTGAAGALLLVHLLAGPGDLVPDLNLVGPGAALGQLPGHDPLKDVPADFLDPEDGVRQFDRTALPAVELDDVEFHYS
jgi:hypothetical protein